MAQCNACGQPIITGHYNGEQGQPAHTVILDASARCYVAVSEAHPEAQDGDRLFLSNAFVEHAAVCRGTAIPPQTRRSK